MGFRKLSTYLVSLRHLRPTQVLRRLWLPLRKKILHRSRRHTSRYARAATGDERVNLLTFPDLTPVACDVSDLRNGTFTFLNHRTELGQPIDWMPREVCQLWRYNLHYFDYTVYLAWEYATHQHQAAYDLFRQLVRQWIDSCPIASPISWDPYPTSLRMCNWIRAYTRFAPTLREDEAFARSLRRSLHIQASYLEDNIEYHLLNTHVLENGRALLYAGLFFADGAGPRWLRKGQDILCRGLDQQFLADGGQYERSPMYHQLMVDLYREVATVLKGSGHEVPVMVADRHSKMRAWLAEVIHPDGQIALLNDAAFGIAGDPTISIGDAPSPRDGLRLLEESGYATFRDSSRQHYLIFDCGPLGPEHQPGHGHCDTLSYELSVAGERMIVDSGVGTYYGDLAWRDYYRSTRAHNTVSINGVEQSEIWDRFRVGHRAHPLDVASEEQATALTYVAASHDGYRRLPGKLVHRRWVCWVDRRFWVVCDRIDGRGAHHIESYIHLHPEVEVIAVPELGHRNKAGVVRRKRAELTIVPWGSLESLSTHVGQMEPIQGWYSPEFGLCLENTVWRFYQRVDLPAWSGYVLWPETSEATAELSSADARSATLDIRADGRVYRIDFDSRSATLQMPGRAASRRCM